MEKKIVSMLVICCLLTISICSVNAVPQQPEFTYFIENIIADIFVDDDAPLDWYDETHVKTIQRGINEAVDGNIIFVFSGNYTENVIIDKPITLIGENKETTVIDGNFLDNTVLVNSSSVNIKVFTVINSYQNSYNSGMCIGVPFDIPQNMKFITDISISNCIISNNDGGIRLDKVFNCNISNCTINDNQGHSIFLLYSKNVMIDNCEIFNNGRKLEDKWIIPGGIMISDDANNLDSENVWISNCYIHNNYGSGIYSLSESKNVVIYNNTICENGAGLYCGFNASNIEIHHNLITKNKGNGIKIDGSFNVSIFNNEISNNNGDETCGGIIIYHCNSNVTVKHNIISSNKKYGVKIIHSSGVDILENNFIKNDEYASFLYVSREEGNNWKRNYWNRPRLFPKVILGEIMTKLGKIPRVEFDRRPAKEPYDI